MNTVILFWNPSISSFSMNDYLEGMTNFEEFQLNWSVYEHTSIFKGDRFYLVRVGEGNTGIVMNGVILSDPYIGEDWNGTDNPRFYIDLDIQWMVHPDKGPVLATSELTKAIPGFDWTGGHSGRVLNFDDSDESKLLNQLWLSNLDKHATDTSLVRYCPQLSLDYVEIGIADSARSKIQGVEILDHYYGLGTDNLREALICDIHYNDDDASLDLIVHPCDSEHRLKFHFTNILKVHWDAPMLNMYAYGSRIYTEYDYLVIEFDDVFLTISSESLEVTQL